jgi:hypothetical protein
MVKWPPPLPAWFWSWAAWYLGRDAFKGHARDPKRRPKSAPARVPAWAWTRLAFVQASRIIPKPRPKSRRQKALEFLRGKLGVTESPAGSNTCWATKWYGVNDQPWCAMSASWAYATAGSPYFARGQRYAFVPYIVGDARNRRNGLSTTSAPIPGDLVCYDWQRDGQADHVGIFERWVTKGRTFYAVEGNTAVGNDSNGGEVMRRLRSTADVQAFVRVAE